MAKIVPPVPTDVQDEETALSIPTNEETKRKIVHNLNFFGLLLPLGSVAMIQINQAGVTAPDSGVWQLCDGSEIVDPLSPLRSIGLTTRFTPDLDTRFLRGADTVTVNAQAGTQDFNTAHDHGGMTGASPPFVNRGATGDERFVNVPHSHPITSDLADPVTVDFPSGFNMAAYMKIA